MKCIDFCLCLWHCITISGADFIGHGGTCPHFYKFWARCTVSRTANRKLTRLYCPSRKRSPKRLIVLVEPKKWRDTTKFFSALCAGLASPRVWVVKKELGGGSERNPVAEAEAGRVWKKSWGFNPPTPRQLKHCVPHFQIRSSATDYDRPTTLKAQLADIIALRHVSRQKCNLCYSPAMNIRALQVHAPFTGSKKQDG